MHKKIYTNTIVFTIIIIKFAKVIIEDMTHLLETPKEKARRANNARLAAYFLELKKQTGATDSRIIASIAAEGKFNQKSFSGVLAALRKTQTI